MLIELKKIDIRRRGKMIKEGSFQKTITKAINYSGTALHSGKEVSIKCLPAKADRGIVFRRVDLPGSPEIKADPLNVVSTRRCTSIGLSTNEEARVHTIEHMMSALWAMGVDNAIIEIDNAETPVGDGSALPFIDLIKQATTRELAVPRMIWQIEEPVSVKKGDMYMVALPYDGFKISYTLHYDHPVIGSQFREFDMGRDSFIDDFAPARTFGFEREIETLHRRGLALGGSLENAVLIGEEGTVNPLRFSDEFARHKVLDVVGDMALNGYIRGHIISVKSGHYLHVELAKEIKKRFVIEEEVEVSNDVY